MTRPIIGFKPEELQKIGESFEDRGPQDILCWALQEFHPSIALACSFGAEDVVLVDMAVRIRPDVRVFYLDTDLLYKETYEVRDRLVQRYGVTPLRYGPSLSIEEQARQYGPELWVRDPDVCCRIRKVEPLTLALKDLKAWITGIRRDQAPTRANAGILEWDGKFGLVKINPLARWSAEEVWAYIRENDVPYNLLHDRGYPSIGCEPCTRPIKAGDDPRSGRWKGLDKTECGLHK